ncbi:pyridoxal phosphate-dependent aminotransferase [Trueperella pyogenes]|uniref:pyridoxal phosphate-dependent aminotransferase n=1 Tax=Trueperella pyogenes TaxID=1661 RepID=UPI00057CBD17|nr:pyridoxal phosphate-dependent aminotransferase [Trueperella pyogenes]AJC69175.1 aspartate aminotransferase [Trueperella pyogenes TP8]ALD74742.1 aspartate aminotransferase [Trueperella pyogenes]MBB3024145.1 aspartate/methionine/tyrosine aminotransferase [Trueperella pyogenes]PIN52326.1 pyridoxal phosphate-dependent aminotransferase [Trueperella pyogenes]WHU56250.1 pyridoxal phosphate-dependent aminotransferase [Trueperella pyogenes]
MATEPRTRVSQRLAALLPSATLAVDAKAKALKAAGKPVIGFGAGEPNFPTPPHIVAAAIEAAADPKNHKYTLAKGLPELRQAIADKTKADSGVVVDPDNIIVTNGGKQAVFQAFVSLIDDGDEVILPAPYWTTYPEAIALCGGVPVEVFAGSDQDYKVTVEQLEGALTAKTKALLLCSPSNPTGSVYSASELRAIGRWALDNGVWVISDEIYEHLIYAGDMAYILHEVPELANQTIIVNGVAKTYAMTGWRVGWMHGPADVMKKVANFQSHITSNVNNVAQRAAIAALTGEQGVIADMKEAFDQRRRTLVSMLREINGFVVPEPTGAFYVFPNVQALLGKEINGRVAHSSAELAELILEEAEVAVVPGEAFGAPGYIRLGYALGDEDLVEGVKRLQRLFA